MRRVLVRDFDTEPSYEVRAGLFAAVVRFRNPADELLTLASKLVQNGKTQEAVFVFRLLDSVERNGPSALDDWRAKLNAEKPPEVLVDLPRSHSQNALNDHGQPLKVGATTLAKRLPAP